VGSLVRSGFLLSRTHLSHHRDDFYLSFTTLYVSEVQLMPESDAINLQTPLHLVADEEEARASSSAKPYRSVVPVQYRKVYGIPFLLMRSHHYGGLKLFLTISSVLSYFVNSYVSPTKNFWVDQIVTYTIEYIVICWIVAPFIQTHDWVANATADGDSGGDDDDDEGGGGGGSDGRQLSKRKRCCWRCRDGRFVQKPPLDPHDPKEVSTRYLPFSLYNDVFMLRHEGFMLNHEVNEALDYFPANAQVFIQSVIFRGLLNLFLFLNALYQVRFVLQNDTSALGVVLTINSLLVCTLNMQAYLWAMVFCVLGTPYWLYLTLMKCGGCLDRDDPDRQGGGGRHADGTRKIMRGSYMYKCLIFVWKRVNF
jgi:hypothetical protein